MTEHSTHGPGSKCPKELMTEALCKTERFAILVETITEKLHEAIHVLPAGNQRERELFHCWMLLITVGETHAAIDTDLHAVNAAIATRGAAA